MIENGRKQLEGQGKFPFREQPVVMTASEMVRPGLALCLMAGSSGHPNAALEWQARSLRWRS